MKVARVNFDKVGAYASAICAVHCVLTGFALGLLSVVGLEFIGSPAAEAGFFLMAVSMGTLALVHGLRRHRSLLPATIFAMGMTSLLVSHFGYHHGSLGGTIFSILGGLSLISFHVLNQRLVKRCTCETCQVEG